MIAELRLSVILHSMTATTVPGIIVIINPLSVRRFFLPSFSIIMALKMITPIFATSAGCSCMGSPGIRIHLLAPFTSMPNGMTRRISPIETKYARTDSLFHTV